LQHGRLSQLWQDKNQTPESAPYARRLVFEMPRYPMARDFASAHRQLTSYMPLALCPQQMIT
jgi:hypothetical protein